MSRRCRGDVAERAGWTFGSSFLVILGDILNLWKFGVCLASFVCACNNLKEFEWIESIFAYFQHLSPTKRYRKPQWHGCTNTGSNICFYLFTLGKLKFCTQHKQNCLVRRSAQKCLNLTQMKSQRLHQHIFTFHIFIKLRVLPRRQTGAQLSFWSAHWVQQLQCAQIIQVWKRKPTAMRFRV